MPLWSFFLLLFTEVTLLCQVAPLPAAMWPSSVRQPPDRHTGRGTYQRHALLPDRRGKRGQAPAAGPRYSDRRDARSASLPGDKDRPKLLSVRLEAEPGADLLSVWERVDMRLRDYLSAQGLSVVNVERSPETPQPNPVSGKFRQVWAEV